MDSIVCNKIFHWLILNSNNAIYIFIQLFNLNICSRISYVRGPPLENDRDSFLERDIFDWDSSDASNALLHPSMKILWEILEKKEENPPIPPHPGKDIDFYSFRYSEFWSWAFRIFQIYKCNKTKPASQFIAI